MTEIYSKGINGDKSQIELYAFRKNKNRSGRFIKGGFQYDHIGYCEDSFYTIRFTENGIIGFDEDGDVFMTDDVADAFTSAEELWKNGYGIAIEEWIVGDGNPLKGKVIIEYVK